MADRYIVNYTRRDVNSFRRKWQALHLIQIPTGDLEILAEVLIAKIIHNKIYSKASFGGSSEGVIFF